MITSEELRELSESTHPLHGDLVRVVKELLAENEVVLTGLHQLEERCDKAEAERDALRAEVDRLIGEKFATEAKINAAIRGQRLLHSDMIARWDEMRDVILHGIDGLDNDQNNSVLGCIDDFYPTDIKPCSTSEESSVTAQSPAVAQMVEALEEARHYVAVYGNGGRPNELLDQMRDALDAVKGIQR